MKTNDTPPRDKDAVPIETACLVVGIGASAGGQAALEQFFTSIPHDCGVAFVVIMHIPAGGPSFLADMLGRYTTMTVATVEEGMPIRPDTVCVIPAGREIVVREGLLRLEEPEPQAAHHPIDRFFRSLAAELKEHAVAVLLSGAGSDGAAGAKTVRDAGGTVIVQEPSSALYPDMPRSAVAAGAATHILPAEAIAAKIVDLAAAACPIPPNTCVLTSLDEELAAILAIVRARTGHDFSSYKRSTVVRRIERRMAVSDVAGIKKYLALLETSEKEAHALTQDILIGVTSFFRDPEAFEIIRREVIPGLFENRTADDPVRIWHACCATGEEVYSMAFLIREYLESRGLDARVQIFATDIDETSIAQARAGLYPDGIETEVGEERLKNFFVRNDKRWQVTKQVREMIVFAHHSVIKNPPFSRLDLLVCRNFLIYLNADMQKRLISLFSQVVKPGGVLFLGSSETAGRTADQFTVLDKKWKLFRRTAEKSQPAPLFPFATPSRYLPGASRSPRRSEALEPGPGAVAERLLMHRYSPPCVVVNESYEVVHISTHIDGLLEVPVGEPTRDILKKAREELRPALRAAIHKTFAEKRPVEFRGLKTGEAGDVAINLLVEPLEPAHGAEKLALVVFEPVSSPAAVVAPEGAEEMRSGNETTLVRQLEEQLRITHEQLQATTEQLDSSNEGFLSASEELISMNEEFQSANEELQSTNEELETSKEELQSLNEELVTVNAELQEKVEELNLLNSDMENLLTSSGIATLFLDRLFTIKRFTPAMAGILNLIPADIGRPFRHLAGTIDWPGLSGDAATVLETLVPLEREVAGVENWRSYLLRILPYRTTDGAIDGVVVTLVDISEHKRLEERTLHLASFPQLNPNPVLEIDAAGKVIFANPATQKILESLGMGREDFGVFLPPDLDEILRNWDRNSEETLNREITVGDRAFGESIFLTPTFGVARIYVFDITARKRAQEALIESEQRVRRKLDSIISPEGDIGNLDLADIIDAPGLQSLVDDFHGLTGMPMGLIDLKGKVLVGVGWQDICTKFHRINPDSKRNCVESDVQLSAGVPHGEYKIYKCRNNLWDVATPVMVGDVHFGNLFMGQFFFEDELLDYELFRSQARQYGFAEQEYIAALEAVPRMSRETLNTSMHFFMKLADILSKQSYSNLKLARSLAERDALMESLRESEERFRNMFERHQAVMLLIEPDSGAIVDANAAAAGFYGHSRKELRGLKIQELNQLSPEEVAAERQMATKEQRSHFVFPHRIATGEVRWVEVYSTPIEARGKSLLFSIIHDITERKWAEEERETTVEFLRLANESRGTGDLVRAATTFFQERSGCEAVGIRLREGEDFPYYEARGFPEEFVEAENRLCACDEAGQPICDSAGNPVIECMCGNVICERFDPAKPFFTARGSFWTNSTTELLASTSEADRQARTRNRCHGEGYESVALIPMRLGEERIGLLQLNDKQKGRFSPEAIALWERLADYLAVALAKFRTDEALSESEEQLKRAQKIAHLGSWELDLVNNRLSWSDEVYRIFGLEPQEFGASYEAFLKAVHPDDRDMVDAAYSGSLREGMNSYEIEHRVVRKPGGEVRIVQEKCEHFRDEAGRIIRSVGMVHDITERKRAEEQIRRHLEELRENNEELSRFNSASVGRELRMIELKKELNELCERAGQQPRYSLDFDGE